MTKLYLATIICSLYQRPDHRIQLLNEVVPGLVMAGSEDEAIEQIRSKLPSIANRNGYEININSVSVLEQEPMFMSVRRFSPAFILPKQNEIRPNRAEKTEEKTVIVHDYQGIICALKVLNYDDNFSDALKNGNTAWHNSDNTWDVVVPNILRNAGYKFEILNYEDIELD